MVQFTQTTKDSYYAEFVQIHQPAEAFNFYYLKNSLNILKQVKHFTQGSN